MDIEAIYNLMGWERADLYEKKVLDTYLTENPFPPESSVEWDVATHGRRTGRTTRAAAEAAAAIREGRSVFAVLESPGLSEAFVHQVHRILTRLGHRKFDATRTAILGGNGEPVLRCTTKQALKSIRDFDPAITHFVFDCYR